MRQIWRPVLKASVLFQNPENKHFETGTRSFDEIRRTWVKLILQIGTVPANTDLFTN